MAVDPNFLAVAIGPMSRPPNVIGMSDIITSTAGIVWSIANLDRHGAWITCVVGPTTIVGPSTIVRSAAVIRPVIAGVGAIILTSTRTERDGNQGQHKCPTFQSRSCSSPCGDILCLRIVNHIRFHTLIIRIRNSLYAPVFVETASRHAAVERVDSKMLHGGFVETMASTS